MSRGHAEELWSILRCLQMCQAFPLLLQHTSQTHSTVRFFIFFYPPLLSAKAQFVNALCWQLCAINSTEILCGRFSSNASLFYLMGKTELHRSGLNPDRHRKVQTRFISASFT